VKKVLWVLLVAGLVGVSSVAYAAGHQVGNIVYTPIIAVPPATLAPVATAVEAAPLAAVGTPARDDTLYDAIESRFGSAGGNVAILPYLSGVPGRAITGVPQNTLLTALESEATSVSAKAVRLILVNYKVSSTSGIIIQAAGDSATEFNYVSKKEVGVGEFTFVDDTGGVVSNLNETGNAYLVLNVKDNSDYDLDRTTGTVRISPVLAKATAGHGGGGGGGCDAGLMGMVALFAVAGGYFLLGKRGA
jgi:hypothetical protein